MLSMERMRLIVIILTIPVVFIAATLTAVASMWSAVFATSYITLNRIVPAKIEDCSTKSAPLVEISNTSNTMANMMNQIPKDVIIKVKSSQIIPVGKESQI
jgi:flagellar basal body-associated protein FliL